MLTRRNFSTATTLGLALSPLSLSAQNYPTRPISVWVGYPPGGGTDVTARIITAQMSSQLGQPIVVENKPGVAGALAATQIARSPADGYSILLNASGAFINLVLRSGFKYNPSHEGTPIASVAQAPVVLVVNNDLPVNNVNDFIQLAQEKPENISYGSDGLAGTTQLSAEFFSKIAGISMLHVPFKGAGPSVMATVAGQVNANFPTLPSAMAMIRAKRVKPLAVSGLTRTKILPDVPTFEELGYRGFDFLCWFGFVGPKGIAPSIVERLNAATHKSLQHPEVIKSIQNQGMEVKVSTPAEWLDFMMKDAKNIERMAKVSNLQIS